MVSVMLVEYAHARDDGCRYRIKIDGTDLWNRRGTLTDAFLAITRTARENDGIELHYKIVHEKDG